MSQILRRALAIVLLSLAVSSCADDSPENDASSTAADTGAADADDLDTADASDTFDLPEDLEHPSESVIYDFANGCVAVGLTSVDAPTQWLVAASGDEVFEFTADSADGGANFFMKASDLGMYLFYDAAGGYLVADDGPLLRRESLDSDVYLVDDTFISGAEWRLEFSQLISRRYQLRNRRTGQLLGANGLVEQTIDAAALTLEPAEGCSDHPEMSLDATGTVERTTYEDGGLFGYVDTHSHMLPNFGFGGGGVFHGAAFHRLGVATAMGDCELFHGPDGRADLLGWGSSSGGDLDSGALLAILANGQLPDPVHATDGWPSFSDWPSQDSETHQTQYYRWLERAWLSGMRLVVQHAVSNEAFCSLMGDTRFQPVRWDCEDMFNIDRQLVEIRRMQDYIDAQSGGPGEGWFRVVESPAEAREVIANGNLAVVLGIEVPNLFSCYLTPRDGSPNCDDEYIEAELDRYYDLGVRVLFPVHKYDNAFTPGDGNRGIIELGNFLQTAHWSNFVQDCPNVQTVFDRGPVVFGGFNEPRDVYLSEPPNPLIELTENPVLDFLPYADRATQPSLEGDWCQKAGLTDAGATLVNGIIARGIILELDHFPRRSYLDAFELLEESAYPGAVGTHGNTNRGRLFEIGGLSKTGFGRCADPDNPGSMAEGFRNHRDQIVAAGGYPAEGFGFDLNGLAGVPGPRFGPRANCSVTQENPVTYPFDSYADDVTFTEPSMGERVVDFNTEGFVHIGMVPELIEDARRTGVSDEDLDILFRSAEGYIRLWERAEARAAELNGD